MGDKVKFKMVDFSEVVNLFLVFKDESLNHEYNLFCENRISLHVTSGVLILYTLFYGYIMLTSSYTVLSPYSLWLASAIYALLIPVGVQFIHEFSLHKDLKRRQKMESILKILISAISGMFCALGDSNRIRIGYPRMILLSPEAMVWIITPLLLSIVFHSTNWLDAFSAMFSGVFCMCLINWDNFSSISGSAIIIYMMMVFCVTYEYRRQNLSKFLLNQNLKQAILENERMYNDMHATEMRHMIANVAHDLKTPLSGFVHVNEIVSNIVSDCEEKHASKTLSSDEMSEYIQSLRSCVKTTQSINTFMLMTINRCIDYTKASQGLKLVPYFGTVNLFDSLKLPLTVMRDIQSKVRINLVDIPTTVCTHIITDNQWIQENILCLLSNAIKYSSGGEVTINIQLQTTADVIKQFRKHEDKTVPSPARPTTPNNGSINNGDTNMLTFEIEDSGIGLSDEDMMNLFNPFKQAQRLTGGTGLGLYSLAKRMEALGGFYGVRKRRDGGQGSRFWFSMPYRPDVQSADDALKPSGAVATPHPMKVSPPTSGGPSNVANSEQSADPQQQEVLHVLIVDDSMPILKLTTMLLKRNGHTIVQAENGSDAVDILNTTEQSFDVVLMDLQMPVMDGFEATRRIRARELEAEQTRLASTTLRLNVSKSMPVHQTIIGMSANSDSDTINEAFAAGMDGFMSKPFALKTFYENVHRVMRGGSTMTANSPGGEHVLFKPSSA